MKKIITYIADDGTVFESEQECINYENKLKRLRIEAVQKEMCRLDDTIWKKFYPNSQNDASDRKLYTAYMWLKADISYILTDVNINAVEAEKEIVAILNASEHAKEILNKYVKLESIRENVKIRSDFYLALSKVKSGSDLASDLDYSFSNYDLLQLAKLHKANKCRKKIENLLTACNYHYECGRFIRKEYDEFLLTSK